MADLRRPPILSHVFVLKDGEVIEVPHRDAHRVLDKRTDQAPTETAWEIKMPSGLVRRVWADDVKDWQMEER